MTTNEISAAQLAANQLNALKSTGPKTEEGKAVARFNARRHGLTGQFYCMSDDDEKAYSDFEADMLKSLKPVGACENQIAIAITQDHWRMNRSRAVEFNLYGRGHDELKDIVDASTENAQAAATMADTFRNEHRVFANIALYETRIHRMISKNEKRLEELQAERKAAEKIALKEAELIVRFADFTDDKAELDKPLLVNGFVFSPAEIIKKLLHEELLDKAKMCAAYGWNPKDPNIRRILKAA